jgi:hypothetical protein
VANGKTNPKAFQSSAKSLTCRAIRLLCGREQEQLAIYRQSCRVVLLYHGGGRVFVAALNRNHNQHHPPQVATCGFFVETSGQPERQI